MFCFVFSSDLVRICGVVVLQSAQSKLTAGPPSGPVHLAAASAPLAHLQPHDSTFILLIITGLPTWCWVGKFEPYVFFKPKAYASLSAFTFNSIHFLPQHGQKQWIWLITFYWWRYTLFIPTSSLRSPVRRRWPTQARWRGFLLFGQMVRRKWNQLR